MPPLFGCEMVSHCGFDLHFIYLPNGISIVIGDLCVFNGKVATQIFSNFEVLV